MTAKQKAKELRKSTTLFGSKKNDPNAGKNQIPEMHTCILRVTEQQGMDFMKKKGQFEPNTDNNFYRKISKYDLDSMSVDWKRLMREKDRQITNNNKARKEVVGKEEQVSKTNEAIEKMQRIVSH